MTSKDEEKKDTGSVKSGDVHEDYGYYFFPRRQDQKARPETTAWERHKYSPFRVQSQSDHYRCLMAIRRCLVNDSLVLLMMRAMKAHGCPVNPESYLVCEPCKLKISGGMDYINNQIVLCENNLKSEGAFCNVIAHELLHSFDYCRAYLDYKNPEHVACTEIRAANLLHCSFTAALSTGSASPLRIKEQQQQCVKDKALLSLMLTRNVTKEQGMDIINKVFNKCYNDLEPIGRRLRKGTIDGARALADGELYGYFR